MSIWAIGGDATTVIDEGKKVQQEESRKVKSIFAKQ
jgi:hypothetical protein